MDEEGLAAQEEYEDLYHQLSSAESEDSDSESKAEPEEDEDAASEQDFSSPSNVLSATTSSVQPVAENEESQGVLEGNHNGQVHSGLGTISSNFVATSSFLNQILSCWSYSKQYKLQAARSHRNLGYTPIGPRMVLRQLISRPPGTAYLGTTASIALGWLGDHWKPFPITFDSGSNITLISQAHYDSLNPKPLKMKGHNITIIQVTGQSSVNKFITVPVIFDTNQGPVEMLVEACIIEGTSTAFILGNNFRNQYQLSLLQQKDGVFIGLGNTGRNVSVVLSESKPRADSSRNSFMVRAHWT